MPEPQIVPPTPTIQQGTDISQVDNPADMEATRSNVQAIFDKVAPPSQSTEPPPAAPIAPPELPQPTPETPPSAAETPPPTAAEPKIPSFIEKALEVDPSKAPEAAAAPATAPDELPEEPPTFKNPEEAKKNWTNFRTRYNQLKQEATELRNRPALDDQTKSRMEFLETQNQEMGQVLNRMSVETHQDFQQGIIRPMHQAWSEAAKIVQEAGGNPDELAKALTLNGRAHFEAIDEIFEPLPDSAKAEAQGAISAYRRLDDQRRAALRDAPKTIEALRKQDMIRQNEFLQKQKKEMESLFDDAVRVLRDEAKVELLQTSTDPDAKGWNEQAQALQDASRKLYLNNTDMKRMAMACILAPMADNYRRMWLQERQLRLKTDRNMTDRYGSEPTLTESGGNSANQISSTQEDLKKPFTDVFLREFHKARNQGMR